VIHAADWQGRDRVNHSGGGIQLTHEQRVDWLRLIRSANVGPRTFHELVQQFGSAGAALQALPRLARLGGASTLARIVSADEAEREIARARTMGATFVALGEPDYPQRLQMIYDAPPLIAVRGQLATLATPMVSVVGARNASAAGVKFTEQLARELGEAGFAVVSGLARGIDAAAHRASIDSGTIAVLAGGHDRVYPPEHETLLDRLLLRGAAISEMPFGWEPRARDFPRRNRLISGLALGVIVVEAAQRSGSLITARMALEQGREVFAVPGSPIDPRTEGSNRLLKQGATLVTEALDVINVLRPIVGGKMPLSVEEPGAPLPSVAPEPDANERTRIVALLGPTPVAVDDLIRISGSAARTVRTVLLELEIAGRLERSGAGMVSLLSP
jgi:DNA processing protein